MFQSVISKEMSYFDNRMPGDISSAMSKYTK